MFSNIKNGIIPKNCRVVLPTAPMQCSTGYPEYKETNSWFDILSKDYEQKSHAKFIQSRYN